MKTLYVCNWAKEIRFFTNLCAKMLAFKISQARFVGRCRVVVLASATGFMGVTANAQVGVGEQEMLNVTRQWVNHAVAGAQSSSPAALKIEVILGQIDSRLRLAPCSQIEPFLPAGSRLWGRTRVGLRCLEGTAKWSIFLPVQVKALGSAWVTRTNVAPGTLLNQEDMDEVVVDWAAESAGIVIDPALWVGQVASRVLPAGQALRQGMFRPAQVFQAGAQVRVVAQGAGFQITSDGQALTPGIVGQAARIRMDNGRIMTGEVLDARTVKIDI